MSHSQSAVLQMLAVSIISEHHVSLEPLRVAYLFQDEAEVRHGKLVPGRTHRATDRDFSLHGFDFVITIAKDSWDALNAEHQYALLDHFISYMGLRYERSGENWVAVTDPDTGRLRSFLKEPDVKEFETVLARHGAYTAEIRSLLRAFAERRAEKKAAEKKAKPAAVEPDVSGDAEEEAPIVGGLAVPEDSSEAYA